MASSFTLLEFSLIASLYLYILSLFKRLETIERHLGEMEKELAMKANAVEKVQRLF